MSEDKAGRSSLPAALCETLCVDGTQGKVLVELLKTFCFRGWLEAFPECAGNDDERVMMHSAYTLFLCHLV